MTLNKKMILNLTCFYLSCPFCPSFNKQIQVQILDSGSWDHLSEWLEDLWRRKFSLVKDFFLHQEMVEDNIFNQITRSHVKPLVKSVAPCWCSHQILTSVLQRPTVVKNLVQVHGPSRPLRSVGCYTDLQPPLTPQPHSQYSRSS